MNSVISFSSHSSYLVYFPALFKFYIFLSVWQTNLKETKAGIKQMIHARLRTMEQIKNSVDLSKVSLAVLHQGVFKKS